MPVIVDTCVFSLVLRRRFGPASPAEKRLRGLVERLIEMEIAVLLGPVRQELLSGIRDVSQYERLHARLRALAHPHLDVGDYERAAEMHNACRTRGIAGASVDFLICGVSLQRDWPVLTTDLDFQRYSTVLPLRLFNEKDV